MRFMGFVIGGRENSVFSKSHFTRVELIYGHREFCLCIGLRAEIFICAFT
jgi:hypothetical protein